MTSSLLALDAPVTWLLAAVVGYLAGSVSVARIAGRLGGATEDLSRSVVEDAGSGDRWEIHGVQASSLRGRVSVPWRIVAVLGDMAKAALPVLAFRVAFPGDAAFAIAFVAAVAGHVWPLYHRFLGGFGITSIMGGALVIDPAVLLLSLPLGLVLGRFLLDRMSMINGFVYLLPPLFLFVTRDPAAAAGAVGVALVYEAAKRSRLTHRRGAVGTPAAGEPAEEGAAP